MDNVLVINCGSSSLKYQLLDMTSETLLAKGLVERIGLEVGKHTYARPQHDKLVEELPVPDHARAIELVVAAVTSPRHGVIPDMKAISAVGHRTVHAGEKFSNSVLITPEVLAYLEECIPLAPLHNPANIVGIKAAQQVMPDVPMVGVFDTAFHQTMPDWAYVYPLPYEFYRSYKVRRYGFHGTSHRYVSLRAAQLLERPLDACNFISCHLGNGASVCAVKNGRSVDTSMGFTPLEGLVMGTRCGDIDPAIVGFLAKRLDVGLDEIDRILNKESGIYGITGISSDLRDVEREYAAGNDRARLGLEVYCYHIRKYIGAYAVALGRVDAIIFTAGVGENASMIREWSCRGLEIIGAELDPFENGVRHDEAVISKISSPIKIIVIPTNEELMIARDTRDVVLAANPQKA
ncbi:MAG TPA: acetate kinase [Candidatus Krumholzibacteria bacterium]|nr:acetate kinase [Candidatus Krumholzibacteria bacterium]HPD72302.1 acetate kinase [Candidatus Krumholzibacteria bacterium]HRY40766.1 acetate kinase [Candidatus Krumholzibacteria bacterium]